MDEFTSPEGQHAGQESTDHQESPRPSSRSSLAPGLERVFSLMSLPRGFRVPPPQICLDFIKQPSLSVNFSMFRSIGPAYCRPMCLLGPAQPGPTLRRKARNTRNANWPKRHLLKMTSPPALAAELHPGQHV